MIYLHKKIRFLISWFLPIVFSLMTIIFSLLVWCFCSDNGTKILVKGIVSHYGGDVSKIDGNFLHGLILENLHLRTSNCNLNISDLSMKIKFIFSSRSVKIKIPNLSLSYLDIEMFDSMGINGSNRNNFLEIGFIPNMDIDNIHIRNIFIHHKNSVFDAINLNRLFASSKIDRGSVDIILNNLEISTNRATSESSGYIKITYDKSSHFDSEFTFIAKSNYLIEDQNNNHLLNSSIFDSSIKIRSYGSYDSVNIDVSAYNDDISLESKLILNPRLSKICNANIYINQIKNPGFASFILDCENTAENFDNLLKVNLLLDKFDISNFFYKTFPQAIISLETDFQIKMDRERKSDISFDLNIYKESQWNKSPLEGVIAISLSCLDIDDNFFSKKTFFRRIDSFYDSISRLKFYLKIGDNQLTINRDNKDKAEGSLNIVALMPNIKDLHDKFSGSINMDVNIVGNLSKCSGIVLGYFDKVKLGKFYKWKNIQIETNFSSLTNHVGSLGELIWNIKFSVLEICLNTIKINIIDKLSCDIFLDDLRLCDWIFDPFDIVFESNSKKIFVNNKLLRGYGKTWESSGDFQNLASDSTMFLKIARTIFANKNISNIEFDMPEIAKKYPVHGKWHFEYKETIEANVTISVYDCNDDKTFPPLFKLDLNSRNIDNTSNKLSVYLKINDSNLGFFDGSCSLFFCLDKSSSIVLNKENFSVFVDTDIKDLSIINCFLKDDIEIGGQLKSNIKINSTNLQKLKSIGHINGEKLRLIKVDDGIRLIDGSISARLLDNQLILDRLFFPAHHRVFPQDVCFRNKIISFNKNITDGYAKTSGMLDLSNFCGNLKIEVNQFPVLQRSDCYGVISGMIDANVDPNEIYLHGKLIANMGLVCLNSLKVGTTLDSDVILDNFVVTPARENSKGIKIKADLLLDLGDEFYLTGLGLDTGLLGSVRLSLKEDSSFSCFGTVSSEENGIIEIYGQRLSLNRGNLTFQGRLDNPLIDVEAIRTGKQVDSGVRVSGTAQHPIIDLVSYPNVSDVEKLSWLLLGRGPDEQNVDMSLLLSMGAALLGGDQPFYRQFGLSSFDIRSGTVGGSGSILSEQIVAAGFDKDGYNDFSTQFIVLSKQFANGINLSLEQSLAGGETVARVNYRLSNLWYLDMRGGSVNGVAFIYKKFFDD